MAEQPRSTGAPSLEEQRAAVRDKWRGRFDTRIGFTPWGRRGPLVDVLDTYENVHMYLMELQGFAPSGVCVDLVNMVLEQKAIADAKFTQEEEA